MEQYTIYCTEDQTRKALELGAPIDSGNDINIYDNKDDTNLLYRLPTAEQMINWLEEQNMIIEVSFRGTDEPDKNGNKMYIYHLFDFKEWEELNPLSDLYQSRKEATLAAVDAALEYLTKNKR